MVMPSVLIIEDDEDGRRAVAKLFARADWKVFEAADGDSGVELALRNRPEVILCDLLMPKSNGDNGVLDAFANSPQFVMSSPTPHSTIA